MRPVRAEGELAVPGVFYGGHRFRGPVLEIIWFYTDRTIDVMRLTARSKT